MKFKWDNLDYNKTHPELLTESVFVSENENCKEAEHVVNPGYHDANCGKCFQGGNNREYHTQQELWRC